MQSYENFPPFPYFMSVLKTCPRAAWVYAQLWQSKDEDGFLACDKEDIRYTFMISLTVFRNMMLALVHMGLLSIKEKPGLFEIELVNFDEEEFDAIEVS